MTESQVSWRKAELDQDDGHAHYDVEFYVGSAEYDYEIGALDGSVWSVDVDREKAPASSASASAASQSGDIGAEEAKSAALAHAGFTASQVTRLQSEQDWDDGRLEYEVEFHADGLEYDYTIDGTTGTVLEHQVDQDD